MYSNGGNLELTFKACDVQVRGKTISVPLFIGIGG